MKKPEQKKSNTVGANVAIWGWIWPSNALSFSAARSCHPHCRSSATETVARRV